MTRSVELGEAAGWSTMPCRVWGIYFNPAHIQMRTRQTISLKPRSSYYFDEEERFAHERDSNLCLRV
jgi:hypothetical protein